MSAPSSPALSRRELTSRLRELRQKANLTLDEVASLLFVSSAKVSRMETGARPVTLRDVSGLAAIYRLTKEEREHLFALAEKGREPAWGEELELAYVSDYNDLEAAAAQVFDHQVGFLPSLVQSEEYARALVISMVPDLTAEGVDQRVRMRVARQDRLLAEATPEYIALIDEAALYRNVGGHAIMRAQLLHLKERAGQAMISARVVPFAAGPHPGLDSPFVLLTFGDEPVSDVAYVEGLRGHSIVDQQPEVERYKETSARIQNMALSESASLALIEERLSRMAVPDGL